ncbi:protein kinase, partial [Myxococcota bacterium]|nr:protein kinase [Myxococcota bacterium]
MLESTLKAGAVLDDRYQLLRQLGAGGCGAVWLAQDGHDSGREVVLKILHPHFDRYSMAVKQLAREAEVLGQLAHPNIAKPFAFSSSGVHTYLVMEHIDGRPLDQEIGAHSRVDRPFGAAEVRRIFEELCSAVSHAHSRTVIHRDLKPQNVMVLKKGPVAVKVLDFGIAKLLEGNIFDATTFGRRLGSMFYMSPEQCKGEPADVRSDVFSLGVIAFEVLTLRRAWAWDVDGRPVRAFDQPVPADGANSLSAVLMRVASAPRPRPSEARPGLSSKLDDVVMRAMSIEPERRFPSVDAFLAELVRGLGGEKALPGFAGDRAAPGFVADLGGDLATVKAPSPALGRPLFGDESDTKMQAAPEPQIVPLAPSKPRVERTEALVEVKEREARERDTRERDMRERDTRERDTRDTKPERASLWKVGGSDAADLLETAMMAEAKEPDFFDADSSSTGPTIGVKDADRIMAGVEAPRAASAAAQRGVRAVSEEDARVRSRDDDARRDDD